MTLQVSRTVPSPNHADSWEHGQPNKLFIHSTRSGQPMPPRTHDLEMQSTTNWFSSANSSASSHLVISPTEIVRVVEDDQPSWHAKEHSWQAWAIEVTQPQIDTPYEEGHYRLLAEAVRHYMALGVPLVHLPSLEWGDIEGGIIGHEESAQGIRDGKSDPGSRFDWVRLFNEVRRDEMLTQEDKDWIDKRISDALKPINKKGHERGSRLNELIKAHQSFVDPYPPEGD